MMYELGYKCASSISHALWDFKAYVICMHTVNMLSVNLFYKSSENTVFNSFCRKRNGK